MTSSVHSLAHLCLAADLYVVIANCESSNHVPSAETGSNEVLCKEKNVTSHHLQINELSSINVCLELCFYGGVGSILPSFDRLWKVYHGVCSEWQKL